ncbi:GNAT family N-acetyltransferase [Phocaeicola abscessus]|uniref:GNAT family N-acetyltransferase n=1 Tax=Phocaeicola abscessus TaxID=555313 RepID=UPI0028E87478|nr:GNAT family N-acetyltransferase [Phocaeicola abscessus]
MKAPIGIREAEPKDLLALMQLFEYARRFMELTGNPHQWVDGYPQRALMEKEIAAGHCFVCLDGRGRIVGTFCFIVGDDPTYALIENGHWLNEEPYGTIHRLASDGTVRGVGDACIAWCLERMPNLRADTHEDNRVMQNLLRKNGFKTCGTIYTHNGTPRLAFQLEKTNPVPI